jgi:cbb3-type cytochrome oxidase subunit 3
MNYLKNLWQQLLELFSDREDPNEPIYDPVHLAGMIVIVIFSLGVLFWLLWTLLVFGGGLPRKIVPAFQVLFTEKKLADFGWVGYPYELGIFEGFIANILAGVLTVTLIAGVWWILEKRKTSHES